MLHHFPFIPSKLAWRFSRFWAWRRYNKDITQNHRRARAQFRRRHGYPLSLTTPKGINDRTYVRKLKDHNPDFPVMSDKAKAREFVAARLGSDHATELCVPILAQATRFDALPARIWDQDVIIKCTHGSAMNAVVKRDDQHAKKAARRKCRKWLGQVHGRRRFEWAYFDLVPSLIVEPLLDDGHILDLKIFCYDGQVRFTMARHTKINPTSISFHARNWDYIPLPENGFNTYRAPCPSGYEEMVAIAEKLSAGFDMLRIDFLLTDARFYLGELTLYNGSGLVPINEPEINTFFAQYWHQPHLGAN